MSPIFMVTSVPSSADEPDKPAKEAGVLEADDVIDLKGTAILGEPIVGTEVVTLDERGQGALPARALPSPKQPTPAQVALHNLTRLPYEEWCTV